MAILTEYLKPMRWVIGAMVIMMSIIAAEYELSVISQMGKWTIFSLWDFIRYARDNGIMVGPREGIGSGSLGLLPWDYQWIPKHDLSLNVFNPNELACLT